MPAIAIKKVIECIYRAIALFFRIHNLSNAIALILRIFMIDYLIPEQKSLDEPALEYKQPSTMTDEHFKIYANHGNLLLIK